MDRISSLCDDIVCHIFSFLPSHDSVKTCFLSKRFRHVWKSVPVLDFDSHPNKANFEKLMGQLLENHMNPLSIRKVRLRGYGSYYSRMNRWVSDASTAVANLEEIDIYLRRDCGIFPVEILSRPMLKTLKLGGWGIEIPSIPTTASLPSLTTLQFQNVTMLGDDDGSQSLFNLITACPAFQLFRIRGAKYQSIIIHDLLLQEDSDSARTLCAFIDMYTTHIHVQLLNFLCNRLNRLTFSFTPLSGYSLDSIYYSSVNFENLTYLTANTRDGGSFLWYLLHQSPNLTTVRIDVVYLHHQDIAAFPPRCFADKLETVEVISLPYALEEYSIEVWIVKYFVKNAVMLKKMMVDCVGISEEAKESIMNAPRGSTQLQINVNVV